MQPDTQSITRRALDVEDYIDVLRRHKSWIFGPAFAALVTATVVAFMWPDTYLSTGVIRVVPPEVPESYVPTNLNSDLQGRLNSMIQSVLNKSELTAVINKFDLYKKERSKMPLEDVVENMRQHDIRIGAVTTYGNVGGGKSAVPAFQVGFAYNNRYVAQKVASDIMARILLRNQRETTDVTIKTTTFLKQNWETAKKKLEEIEGRLSTFRQKNLGHLPEQQQSNFNQLTALQTQLLNLNTSMTRVNQEKLVMEGQIRIYKDRLAQMKDPAPQEQAAVQKSEKLADKEKEVDYYERGLAAARERYRESHPDVQSLLTKLNTAKKQRDDIIKEESARKPEVAAQRPVSADIIRQQRDIEDAIKRLQSMIDAKDLEMQDYQKGVAQANGNLKSIQERLQGMPTGLKDYDELMRDRELAKKDYEELDKKVSNSEIATRAINNLQGERLEQLEDPSLPITPTEPKRPMIILSGLGIGVVLGLFLAGAREVKDTSLKNLKDVRAYTQLPILGSIPLLENDLIVRRRRRLSWLAWATACLVGAIVMSSSVVYYYATKV